MKQAKKKNARARHDSLKDVFVVVVGTVSDFLTQDDGVMSCFNRYVDQLEPLMTFGAPCLKYTWTTPLALASGEWYVKPVQVFRDRKSVV